MPANAEPQCFFALVLDAQFSSGEEGKDKLRNYNTTHTTLNYILSFWHSSLAKVSLLCGYIKILAGMAELSEIVVFDKGLAWFISMAWRLGHSAICGEIGDLSMGPLMAW